MHREVYNWYSPHLNEEMRVAVYGHWGFALLLFPPDVSDYLEYERQGLIGALTPMIDVGKVKVFCVSSVAGESWLNQELPPAQRAMRQQQYNAYVIDEVVPFIVNQTSPETMIVAAGVSFGAFLAANTFFHRPDLFGGVIAMSGMYDIKLYADGYYDGNCYFNNPVDYLPNLNDPALLDQLRSKTHIYLLSGKGDEETPEHSIQLAEILGAKGIPCHLDLWGEDIKHDWPTWRAMLPHVLSTRL